MNIAIKHIFPGIVIQFVLLLPSMVMAVESVEQLDRQILKAQAQRVQRLNRAVALLQNQYREGTVDVQRVIAAQLSLVEAVLATATTSDERIASLEEQLKTARTLQGFTERRFQGGQVTEVDVQEAEAARLLVRIKLLQEQRKKIAANDG